MKTKKILSRKDLLKKARRKKLVRELKIALLAIIVGLIWMYVATVAKTLTTELLGSRVVHITNIAEAQMVAPAPIQEIPEDPTQSTIKKVAKAQGMDWKVLMGICLKESGCKIPDCSQVVGACDGYKSWGYFQINEIANPTVTMAQANDLEWSATWTAKRLKKYARIGGWDYAIRKHNGNADYNFGDWRESFQMTADYLADVKNIISTL